MELESFAASAARRVGMFSAILWGGELVSSSGRSLEVGG